MRGLIQALHDDHGFFALPGEALPARRALVTRAPELELRGDGTAVLRLHAVDTTDAAAALAWATSLHEGIAAVAARHPRGWVIDLRDHDGDSPFPSLAALSTLLAGPAVGNFTSRQGKQEWIVERGAVRIAGGAALVDTQSPPEPDFRGPVALLLGPGTRDAGEDVAVAFRGRPNTRLFGKLTAGFPQQGVQVHRLSDGSTLGVLEIRAADRTGVVHRVPLEPETLLEGRRAPRRGDAPRGRGLGARRGPQRLRGGSGALAGAAGGACPRALPLNGRRTPIRAVTLFREAAAAPRRLRQTEHN